MSAFDKIHTAEDFLKAVDEKKDIRRETPETLFSEITERIYEPLSSLMQKLMSNGFTRREAMRLVEAHQSFIYNMMTEEFLAQKRQEHLDQINDLEGDFEDDDDDDDILNT